MNKTDGGPAFPRAAGVSDASWPTGMSLRDYFAAAALPLCDRSAEELAAAKRKLNMESTSIIAAMAYELADAMLAAREK